MFVLNLFVGLIHPELPFRDRRCNGIGFKGCNAVGIACRKVPRGRIRYFHEERLGSKCVAYAGRNRHELSFANDSPKEPFLLSSIKEAFWALKSLFEFLVDQPSQLKYIECQVSKARFLKTAILTLVLVAALIVALSSIDSALCFLLTMFLRRTR
ncbi:hypothetical protein CK203_085268 [Vitis vinifera]|uniref:Transmembrane protein n=1 Tax=Vitis vinifera TaxID=29760 RepID=A0A438DSL1_VITVI|nr:hypothetical protein CK203_085268 [Vitis vinifera]